MSAMVEHHAVVRRVSKDKVTLAVDTSGCGGCAHGSSCGLGKLSKGGAQAATLLELKNDQALAPGDHVTLHYPTSHLTITTLFGYLMPALALILGSGIGMNLYNTDQAAALGAVIGFLLSLVFARIALPHMRRWIPEPLLIPEKEHGHE